MSELPRRDPLRTLIRILVYAVFCYTVLLIVASALWGLDLPFITAVGASLTAAVLGNLLGMRIYEQLSLWDIGLWWNARSGRNLRIGLAGGAGAACLVLGPALVFGAARFQAVSGGWPLPRSIVYVILMLALGSAAEELLFHGYAFQVLLQDWGAYAAVLPIAVVFALMHTNNPAASPLGLINTAAFGAVFGYAFLRSRDLWLPIGLHFGWNVTLPFFGVNVSGLKIGLTGYQMEWSAGTLWSGGDYGPEGSVLTSAVILAMLAYLWRAPVRRQASRLLDSPAEDSVCAPEPPQSQS